jgi:PAS domain S-box-containing protein
MKIRTKLDIIAILAIVVLVWAVCSFICLHIQIAELNRQQLLIRNLTFEVFQSNQVRDEYFIHKSDRSKQQWFVLDKNISEQLKTLSEQYVDTSEKDLEKLIHQHKGIARLFNQLIQYDQSSNVHDAEHDIREMIINQMMGESHRLYQNCYVLSDEIDKKNEKQALYSDINNILSFGLLGLLVIIFSKVVKQEVTKPLTKLRNGTRIIAEGNFDHRLNVIKPDEIGDLARDFDFMTERLASITVSRDELSKEVEKRIRSEETLRESEEKYRNLFNNSEVAIFRSRFDGSELLDVNRKFLEMLGMTQEEAIGKPSAILWADLKEREEMVRRLTADGRVAEYEYKMLGRQGEIKNCITSLVLYREQGILEGSIHDISERRRAEEEKLLLEKQLHQAQKLESLGVLAGGIAHDFNNILAVIMCYSSLGQQQPEKAAEFMSEIEKAAERAAGLCRQMLAYAGKTQFVESHVDMTLLLDEMLNMLKSTIPQNVTIKPYLTGDMPQIKADASQIRQIVMNLIINASEAIGEEQGDIRVALTKSTIGAEQTEKDHIGKAIAPGAYLCLEVTDTGCGMDDETKQRIFEPFYTTKFPGRGLGMSAVLGVITSHKGALQLSSQPGQGTTFKVYLPVQTGEKGLEPLQRTIPSEWRGSGTILLVEDEPQLTAVGKTLLETLGFSVIEASNGIEAIEKYRKYAAEITLVVTDIGMPLMGGYELIAELKKLDPALPVIVSSGFGDKAVTSKLSPEDVAGLISKPYRLDQLREVLKSAVENMHASGDSESGSQH